MSDFYDDSTSSSTIDAQVVSESASADTAETQSETMIDPDGAEPVPSPEAKQEPEVSPVEAKFKSCRWHETQDSGAPYCSHRDVLPLAGKNGFNSDAWCPECAFFKVKRTVKKRAATDYNDYY